MKCVRFSISPLNFVSFEMDKHPLLTMFSINSNTKAKSAAVWCTMTITIPMFDALESCSIDKRH